MNGNDNYQGDNQDSGRETIYHYSREHRLSRAPDSVREAYSENAKQTGLFKNMARQLGGGRNTKLLLFVILFSLLAFGVSVRFSSSDKGGDIKLGGNSIAVAILAEGDILILDIIKTAPNKGEPYTGAVDIAISPILSKQDEGEAMPPIYTHRISFTSQESESFQMSIPFDGTNFFVLLKNLYEEKSLKIGVSYR